MTAESQNYNGVPERIWDQELGGFRPQTAAERRQRAADRAARNRRFRDVDPATDEQEDLADYIEYVREHSE